MHDFLYIKNGSQLVQVMFADIQFFVADDKYTRVVTPKREFLTLKPLAAIEKAIPSDIFCRVHRSYIISLIHAAVIKSASVHIKGSDKKIPVGKQYRGVLNNRILILDNEPAHANSLLSHYDLLKLFKKVGRN